MSARFEILMGSDWEICLRMPPQTDMEKAPHWLVRVTEKDGEVSLDIPEAGGQMSASLAIGEDSWLAAWFAGKPGIKQTWSTSWTLRDRARAEELAAQLVRELGAQRVDSKRYMDLYGELSDFVWKRVPRP